MIYAAVQTSVRQHISFRSPPGTLLEEEPDQMSKLLAYLIARPGQLISLRILMRQVWETNYVGDMRTIHVHIS